MSFFLQALFFYCELSDDCIQVALRCNGSDELRPCFSSGTDFLHPSPPTPTRRHLVMSLRHLWLSHIREGVTDNQWIKVRDAVKYTTMHKNKTVVYSPKQRNIWSRMSVGLRLRNLVLVGFVFYLCQTV